MAISLVSGSLVAMIQRPESGPTLGQVAHDYWQELVVVKMEGTPLYWDRESQKWTMRVHEATRLTRREANQRFPNGLLQCYSVTFERLA